MAARAASWLELRVAEDALTRHSKQQRVDAAAAPKPKEPEWRQRAYAADKTVEQWRKEEGVSWNRRRVPLSGEPGRPPSKLPRPSKNDDKGNGIGYLDHWRRGLVGAVLDWAEGSDDDDAYMLAKLVAHLGLQKKLKGLLFQKEQRHAEVQVYICRRIREALAVTKGVRTKAQELEHICVRVRVTV